MALILDGSLGITPAPTLPNYTLLDTQTFTANGTWTKPNVTGTFVVVRCWGAGGSGGGGSGTGSNGGGGGGFNEQIFLFSELTSTVSVTIGAGGTAVASGNTGNAGGNTTFGAYLTAYGGGGGGTTVFGGGGNSGSAGGTNNGNTGSQATRIEKYIPIVVTGGLTASTGTIASGAFLSYFSANPKAYGDLITEFNTTSLAVGGDGGGSNAGNSIWGGGGGARSSGSGSTGNTGGTSTYAGAGGNSNGGGGGTVTAGTAPSGGGGAAYNGTSGAGARGQCIVYVY